MKVAIVSDTHLGFGNDKPEFHRQAVKFFGDVFFPYVKANGVEAIIHLGDLVDKRRNINYTTLKVLKESFLRPIEELDVNTYIIAGNHDCYYTNTNDVNALSALVNVANVHILTRNGAHVKFGGVKFLLLPWIAPDTQEAAMRRVAESDATVLCAHLPLIGFPQFTGHLAMDGFDPKDFAKFETVLTGHWHHRSTDGNITYVGSPYEMSWVDHDNQKGFHVYDTEKRELSFIANPHKMFHRLTSVEQAKELKLDADSKVRFVIDENTDAKAIETAMAAVEAKWDISIMNTAEPATAVSIAVGDTLSIIKAECDGNVALESILTELYVQATTTAV